MRNARSIVAAVAGMVAAMLVITAPAAADFGVTRFETAFLGPNGNLVTQAGLHPFAFRTNVELATVGSGNEIRLEQAAKDLLLAEPTGFVGRPKAVQPCATVDFLSRVPVLQKTGGLVFQPGCPDGSAVGKVVATFIGEGGGESSLAYPVYDLEAPPGKAAKLGFFMVGVPITVELGVGEAPPYEVVGGSTNISQVVELVGVEFTLWGVPADPRHDAERGHCVGTVVGTSNGQCTAASTEVPFLTMPRACAGPLSTGYRIDSWQNPGLFLTGSAGMPAMTGCASLGFDPTITARPTSRAATSPTGLDFSLDVADEGINNPKEGATANADVEKAVVALPQGFSINPSQAEGLTTCSEADLARETAFSESGSGCPDESKIGSVEVETPLLEQTIKGALYVATPYENPEKSLIALYMVLQNRELGISIKQPLRVDPDDRTGQITTIAESLPQLPFSHFKLHFKEGTRSPLATPAACGHYAADAVLYPYSGTQPVHTSSAFEIISGPEAGPCPAGGTPPFHPGLEAGTTNNAAGRYSPFYLRLTRGDGQQEITHFSIKLPPGVTGKLAGIPFCSDLQIAAAKARERTPHGGQEELDRPSCPAGSEIGTTLVGAGVGPSLTYVPGKVYLAGPYHGSNLSIVAITAAKAGPFDLGTVVIREALKVDPETAEVSVDAAGSDPLPHIIEGIPVDLRDIRVHVDRSDFVLNPTFCEPTSTASTVLGSGTNFASEADDRPVTVTTRFQAADCASLGFKPKLKLMLKGPTKRAGLPRLKAVVMPRPGDANIGRAVVTLPRSEFLEQGHIKTVCTRVQFNAGGGNGEQCPAGSVYGRVRAWTPLLSEPLSGPVFLRSNGGERKLPDLLAALHSKDIDINLLGFIRSLHPKGASYSRIRTIFAAVPDAPVSRFVLEMFGGKKSLLVNSVSLCKGKHRAISSFVGQNGKRSETRPPVQVRCKKPLKKHRKRADHRVNR